MRRLLLPLLLVVAVTATLAADPVSHVQAAQAARIIAEGKVLIIDVRTAEEFNGGHIFGALNIDIYGGDFEARLAKLDKNQPTLVHCQAGGRSTRALETFAKLGFTHVIHLDGGFAGWEDAGQAVAR